MVPRQRSHHASTPFRCIDSTDCEQRDPALQPRAEKRRVALWSRKESRVCSKFICFVVCRLPWSSVSNELPKQHRPWVRDHHGTPQCETSYCETKYHSARRRTLVRGGCSGLGALTRGLILNSFITFHHESYLQMSEIYAYA